MTSSAKSLAIQYALAKRQAQNTTTSNINNNNNSISYTQINSSELTADAAETTNMVAAEQQLPSADTTPTTSSNGNLSLLSPTISSGNDFQATPEPAPAPKQANQNKHQATFNKNSTKQQQHPATSRLRPKSTSMTNLVQQQEQVSGNSRQHASRSPSRIANSNKSGSMQRPASRSALDQIHKGMNAKYASVQSKVLLQNIRPNNSNSTSLSPNPNAGARRAGTLGHRSTTPTSHRGVGNANSASTSNLASSERAQAMAKMKQLQEQLEATEAECEALRLETERDKKARSEQVAQLKQELQDKLAEHERQNEDQHQKLMEAYELADQNRRAADSVLSDARQRDDEARKRIEELESQLSELKEFVAMKDEMNGKLYELREQLREERERYEEQLKNLHTVFDSEKISPRTCMKVESAQQTSNYFARPRNNNFADSSESITIETAAADQPGATAGATLGPQSQLGCSKCRGGASNLHKSEFDLYGSRLSTRMQDTAKSAWRSTKKLASSVVTSGVSFTACRHKSTSASMRVVKPKKNKSNKNINTSTAGEQQETIQEAARWLAQSTQNNEPEAEQQQRIAKVETSEEDSTLDNNHTSVIKLEASNNNSEQRGEHLATGFVHQQQNQAAADDNCIHKDHNNKLTIVTKFSPPPAAKATGESGQVKSSEGLLTRAKPMQVAPTTSNSTASSASSSSLGDHDEHEHEHSSSGLGSSGPASATGGDRSRCESASSGRGTSDDELAQNELKDKQVDHHNQQTTTTIINELPDDSKTTTTRHKRHASSVFKASQLLPTAANQLKSQFKLLFTPQTTTTSVDIVSPVVSNENNSIVSASQQPQVIVSESSPRLVVEQPAKRPPELDNNQIDSRL